MPIKIVEGEDNVTKCPYCKKNFDKIEKVRPLKDSTALPLIYRCPYCKTLLSISIA